MHLVEFGFGDSVETGAASRGFAVFDFGEVDIIVFDRNEINFVKMSLVILFENSVAVLRKIGGDGLFGGVAGGSGVFVARFGYSEVAERFTRLEGTAVFRGEAVLINSGNVGFGAIADMVFETIVWVFGVEVCHVLVAGDFGDDGGGRDFADFAVGFDEGGGVGF